MKILFFALITAMLGVSVGVLYVNRNIPLDPVLIWCMAGMYALSVAFLEAVPWW